MKERIELHTKTMYSYKRKDSVITIKELLEFAKKENIKTISIIDFCTCASITEVEKLKKEMEVDVKIIYGVSLNIGFVDLLVPSVLIAKNQNGIKKLYRIISMLNKKEIPYLTIEELNDYLNDLILGISEFDNNLDYTKIIKYYNYIEVTPRITKEEVLNLNEFCLENKILLIATSTPTRINKNDLSLSNHDEYYLSTKEMLESFNYLKNKEDVVINNAYEIVKKVEDYNFEFNTCIKLPEKNKNELRNVVYERANLIYLDSIPKEVKMRLEEELDIIYKQDLAGTILLLESIKNKAQELKSSILVGSYFAHSMVAYLLGLIPINPIDDVNDLLPFLSKETLKFEIFAATDIIPKLKQEITEVFKVNLFNCSTYKMMKLNNEKNVIKRMGYIPDTYYVVPKYFEILNFTSLEYLGESICFSFINTFTDKCFVTIRFRPTNTINRISLLSQKTDLAVDCIPLENKKVLKESFFRESFDACYCNNPFIFDMYSPRLRIRFTTNFNNPKTIYDLINLDNKENPNWLSKVVLYYYDAYYRTFYPKDYYELYLSDLLENFTDEDKKRDFFKKVNMFYRKGNLTRQAKLESDVILSIIMQTINVMYKNDMTQIVQNLLKK